MFRYFDLPPSLLVCHSRPTDPPLRVPQGLTTPSSLRRGPSTPFGLGNEGHTGLGKDDGTVREAVFYVPDGRPIGGLGPPGVPGPETDGGRDETNVVDVGRRPVPPA